MELTITNLYSELSLHAIEKRELLTASFELTARCNLQCKMCYVSQQANDKQARTKELTAGQWICIGEEAREAGLLFVTFTGGEVFLREDFKEIYEEFMKLGFIITVYTNGTMITPEIVSWLAKLPPYKISITMYGASRETYQRVTGNPEGFDRTVRAIDSLLAQGIRTDIKTTVIRENMHEYDQLLEFAMQRKLILGIVNYVSPRREGFNSDPLENRLSPQELVQYEVHMNERDKQLGVGKNESKSEINDPVTEGNPIDMAPKQLTMDSNDAFQCAAGKCSAWVTWDGRLLPCGLMDIPQAFPLERGLLAAWEELKQKCTLVTMCKECRECQYRDMCEHCPARLFRETGYYDRPAPYLCDLAKKRGEDENWLRR